ncbi:MAG: hypothetical protein Q9209_003002 [Squamulea sp. 1 TL-2023]
MTAPASSVLEDPWDWNTDQVVTALCDPNAHFRATNNARSLPDATHLEQKLRKHLIEGPGLLTDLEHPILRKDFGITIVGHRGYIVREIQRLRRSSSQYIDHIRGDVSNFGTTRNATPSLQLPLSSSRQLISPHTPPQSTLLAADVPKTPPQSNEVTIPQNEGSALLQASIRHSQEWLDQLPDISEGVSPGSPVGLVEHQTQGRVDETYIIDDKGRKRRRLVLNPLALPAFQKDSEDQDPVDAHTTAGEDSEQQLAGDDSPSQDAAPTDMIRKRVAPILLSQPFDHPPVAAASTKRKLDLLLGKNPSATYLGTKALPVDDVFYDPEIQDKNEWAADDFAFLATPASTGQRRYISSRIKYFLGQRPSIYQRGNKARNGICPYPDSLGRKHQTLSITIFESTPDGVLTTRRNRSQWLLNGALLASEGRTPQGPATNDSDKLVMLPSDNGQNWDYLNKWNNVNESSAVLPVYGESGSEGDYDSDTWREMGKEYGEPPKSLGRPRKLHEISGEESSDAIDEAVQQMKEDWNQKRLPILSRSAWTIWSKSRREGSMRATVLSLQYELQHYETRFNKLRKDIVEQHWLSAARVRRQCESMRRTVYGIEDSKWTIDILQSDHRPMKPRRLHKIKKNESTQGTEIAETECGAGETSTDEDLGGFVVDDDEASSLGDTGGLLYTSNEDIVYEDMTNQSSATVDNHNDDHPGSDSSKREHNISVEGGTASVPTPTPLKRETVTQSVTPNPGPANFVDLTLSDSSDSESVPRPRASEAHDIKTPFAYSADFDENEEPSQRSQRKRAEFKVPPGIDVSQNTVIDLENDNTYESDTEQTLTFELPELSETKDISKMDPNLLMERADRKRLLIYILAQKDLQQRKDAYTYITNHDLERAQKGVWKVFPMLRRARSKVVETRRKACYDEILKNITAWYICWTNAEIIKPNEGATQEQIDLAQSDKEGFSSFYDFLSEVRCLNDFELGPATTADRSKAMPSKQRRVRIDYSDEETITTPTKKRMYAVPESQEAADTRQKAHRRLADREKRQLKLKKTLRLMGKSEEDPSQVIVNMGKLDHQGLIYLLPSIGGKIQPHQKDGLRFLWREIIEDHASQQGCLLAQTMGLGKTMQVISFLVTVAHAAQSSIANIRQQIPSRLRQSQTIVLCPPTLVENWYDEFLIWAPEKLANNIGDVRTVSSAMAPFKRLQTIKDWDEEGGILVLPFSLLRSMIENRISNGQTPLDEEQHSMVKRILLQRPNIVVADEAHTFKNHSSQINRIMHQFASSSRIALTGSPLSNSLSEYYALIEWIAPGYLGEPTEFRSRYEEPISQGLYRDSTMSEWRRGLMRLELFKREVAPKIHRADLSVLKTSLKGKSEFVIKVAPTELQQQLYQLFVNSMSEQYKGTERQTTLWGWVCILRLICNHPKCYYDKLKSPPVKGRKTDFSAREEEVAANDDQDIANLSPLDLGIPDDVIDRQLEPFKNISESPSLTHVSLSNKMKVLLQILNHSIYAGDRILVFTHSLQTLDYIENLLIKEGKQYLRMDGSVRTDFRQKLTKNFNHYGGKDIFIISTRAGGTGLNLAGANRVVIMDDSFNPTWEEQAIGRAYRIGQVKPVFVYRLTVGGTFEEVLHNQSLFKQQLATRAVDKKNIARSATRGMKDYLQPLKAVEQADLKQFVDTDRDVLASIVASQIAEPFIRDIVPCETFRQEIDEKLTDEEQKEVEMEEADSRLRRADPAAYQAKLMAQSANINTNHPLFHGTQQPSTPVGLCNPPQSNLSRSGGQIGIASAVGKPATQGKNGSSVPTQVTGGSYHSPVPPLAGSVPPDTSSTARNLSNTAKLSGDLVPHGTSVSLSDPRQVENDSEPQDLTNGISNQLAVPFPHPMLPIMGANTTLRTGGSVPPKQNHVDIGVTRRAESEPQEREPGAAASGTPSKEARAIFPVLQGLLDREAKRSERGSNRQQQQQKADDSYGHG